MMCTFHFLLIITYLVAASAQERSIGARKIRDVDEESNISWHFEP